MLGFLWGLNIVYAQKPINVSGSFSKMDVKSILLGLESRYAVRFFFQESELPDSLISVTFEEEPILKASNRMLQGSNLQAIFIKTDEIVIGSAESIAARDTVTLNFIIRQDKIRRKEEASDLYQLEAITISSREDNSIEEVSGVSRLDRQQIETLPAFMGEPDLIKSIQYIPGVSSLGEGVGGFSVRGGNTDENLLLLGENMLFNANHAFGFFGSINTHLIREVNLYKGAIPAYHGGRLSSVLEVQMKQASTETLSVEGGIGPLSTKLLAEIPIKKGRSSLLIGGRSVYSDWLLSRVNIPEVQNSSLFFYDVNVNYLHKLGDRASLTAELYASADDFQFADVFGFAYKSHAASLNLRQILGKNLSSTLSLSVNSYQSTQRDLDINKRAGFSSGISYYKLKEKASYSFSEAISLDFGASAIYYKSQPGERFQLSPSSNVAPFIRRREQALELAAFAQFQVKFASQWSMLAGFRFTHYNALGPGQRFVYQDDQNPQVDEVIDSLSYGNRKRMVSYQTPEPRLALNYLLSENHAVKGGYSRMAQYIFQQSSFDASIPTDAWTLGSFFFRPQRAHNVFLEYAQKGNQASWSASVAAYYRWMSDVKDYIDFADLFADKQVETEIVHAQGRAYGLELNLKKARGDFQFDLSYTLSRTERKTNASRAERSINANEWYLGNFDKPHEINLYVNYRFNKRESLALTFNYNTGRPTTGPMGYFDIDGQNRIPIYSGRNQLRIPDYHRLDITYTLGRSEKKKKWKGSWTFGIYNVYGRKNAYSVFFTQARFANVKANRLSILGSAFPAISYNFKWIRP